MATATAERSAPQHQEPKEKRVAFEKIRLQFDAASADKQYSKD